MGLQFGLLPPAEPSGSFKILRARDRATLAINPFRADSVPARAAGVAMITGADEAIAAHQRVAEAMWREALKGGRRRRSAPSRRNRVTAGMTTAQPPRRDGARSSCRGVGHRAGASPIVGMPPLRCPPTPMSTADRTRPSGTAASRCSASRFRNRRFDGAMSGDRTWELWRRGRAAAVLPYDPLRDWSC